MVWFGHLTLPTIYFSRRSFCASHVSAVSAKPPNLRAYTAISGLKKELWVERAPFIYFPQFCCNNAWYSSRDKVPCTIKKKCVALVCLLLRFFGHIFLTLRIWLKGIHQCKKRGVESGIIRLVSLESVHAAWNFWNKLVQTPFCERPKTTQRRVKSLKWDLSNNTTFNPPPFSLVNTLK